ncbi:MAG: alpha-amylase [Candidatus Hydrogenedentes bacterium]|nr:alpha-amylase [Candidatus Hydrogenedentota bacterium]
MPDTLSNLIGENYFPFGFHLTRKVWHRCGVADLLRGKTIGETRATVHATRQFVQRVNSERAAKSPAEEPIRPGHALTLGLLTDILRYVVHYYCWQQKPGVLDEGLNWTRACSSDDTVESPPPTFVNLFPPAVVELKGTPETEFLTKKEGLRSNKHVSVIEMVLLRLAISNPALKSFIPLFSDDELKQKAPYKELVELLESFFANQPPVDALGMTLFESLRAPMKAAPNSLDDQLEYIRAKWAHFLPADLIERLLVIRGILREETFMRGLGAGSTEVLRFGRHQGADADIYPEAERFSPDADWMSNVVMIAKTIYVWLDQLSKKYERPIYRLDHVPDEELDRLARWGFNCLWLIGVWERSTASEDIKRIMGNPEAVASAYSLFDYDIAADLGGDEAYQNLRDRAWQRGIRLASDMVPNHMGIYSRWVIEHPQWFLQLDYPPYPAYQFTGTNLSRDPRVGLYIEDGYWTHRDAAVVFKRVDNWTGDAKYIYHGNDGTSMPWNDTAQLNYLLPEVREAVIQTILHVARQFPVIRFDAAMTLAKKHYQRLWFPKPGDAGAIPSRAEHGMSRADFDTQMPEEFWREVVDRVAQEAPDTLLLAEAFWLMEGYFVRTLGMHRVYNSAFMNMLKMEQNSNYRETMRNVLEFSPEVLKRFVNFMNNPDERTAVEQFGKGDKYIGVALLMVTLPGLPMFGHGQIEGFTEKYGMEYRRAYWEEQVDEELVARHEREIFPLSRRRYQFSGVQHFAFYDFHADNGHVDENVFAYSNRAGDHRSIVFYNNSFGATQGWIKTSTGINTGRGDEGTIVTKSLADSLGLRGDDNVYYIFRDHRDNLEYIRSGRQLCDEGLFVHLYGYQYHVFLDFREVYDSDGSWGEIAWHLGGGGVPSVELAKRSLVLAPLREAFREAVNAETLSALMAKPLNKGVSKKTWEPIAASLEKFLTILSERSGVSAEPKPVIDKAAAWITGLRSFEKKASALKLPKNVIDYLVAPIPEPGGPDWALFWRIPLCTAILLPIDEALHGEPSHVRAEDWLEHWMLAHETRAAFVAMGRGEWEAEIDVELLSFLLDLYVSTPTDSAMVKMVFEPEIAKPILGMNQFEGVEYVNRERLESALYWLTLTHAAFAVAAPDASGKDAAAVIQRWYTWSRDVLNAAQEAGYRVAEIEKVLLDEAALEEAEKISHARASRRDP